MSSVSGKLESVVDLSPICGPAPVPGAVPWNTEPGLLAALVIGAAFVLIKSRHRREPASWPTLGWVMLSLALVTPLCSLSVALFSMRVTQHLVITLVAAPLLAMALTGTRAVAAAGMAMPTATFAILLWAWHVPAAYHATFNPDGIAYWLMHVTLAGSATWFWAATFRLLLTRPLAASVSGLVTAIQMGVLGALLTFAPRPLYAVHAPQFTLPWGLTPLEDQQLGGLLMWVPGGVLFVVVLAAGAALGLRPNRQGTAGGMVLTLALTMMALSVATTFSPRSAFAQGNDSSSSSSAPSEGRTSAAPVGVLTTSSVTTGNSGPKVASREAPEGADRRTRVLSLVCEGLSPAARTDCQAKSGM